jgi:hypothetical protein
MLHFVFDFDCTLTARHLYHCLRSGEHYRSDLLEQKIGQWDERSKRIAKRVEDDNFEDPEWEHHKSGLLPNTPSFQSYIFGDEERIRELGAFLRELKDSAVSLHISTKGIVSEVVDVLRSVNLIEFFELIEGFDNQYVGKLVYRVGHGFVSSSWTKHVQSAEVLVKNRIMFESKPAFISAVLGMGIHGLNKRERASHVVFLDDDDECYKQLTEPVYENRVITIPIGSKEQYYSNGVPNLNSDTMQSIVRKINRLTIS